ncbi:hypothetical protein G5V58_21910 [Nocardioides anomalus]|uniref:IPT/TIG domain-containing protein n=1 Tax=Nocardioides anomalus TaxID=2712223 RepID=A0A6G6WIJ4_9ACTN|nr:IPT/TIG domain-containing protein [Nocardioides anomalus]QIG45064.1 hypothetical protein G5V58_21910 [Nocardioides anomalus]
MRGRMRPTALAVLIALISALVALVGAAPGSDAAGAKLKKPVVTQVDPKNGSTDGGTVVTLRGKHLKTAKKVLFGGSAGTSLKVASDKQLTVVSPPHAAGLVDVRVVTKAGKSAKSSLARYTFAVVRPQVAAISPTTGPTAGGTRVTVTGTGFNAVTSVTFAGVPGTDVTVTSPTSLQVTSPPHAAGVTHINVVAAGGTSPTKNTDIFRYADATTMRLLLSDRS